jgi:phospholipid/cholesterol/gamma-HCH transport system substrate-binding protein
MNERVMQFRIGMFVIVAGLVLTMLLIWFGESPSLFQDQVFVTVHYKEAPGAGVGIPVRKSGMRVGAISQIDFDRRPGVGDGVLVTLALERKFRIAAGSVPRLGRALLGDTSIDLLPGPGASVGDMVTSATPIESMMPERIIEGTIAPDPALALEAASRAFEKAGGTLTAIEEAAKGVSSLTGKADKLEEFLTTWSETGSRIGSLAEKVDKVVVANEGEIQPTLSQFRQAAERFNTTFDETTAAELKATARNLATASARIDRVIADIGPIVAEMGATGATAPVTQVGQAVGRINRITYDLNLLTSALSDSSGRRLNPNGSLQKLLTEPDLYDNFNRAALGINDAMGSARPVIRSIGQFADRLARDPGLLTRGVLQGR